MSIKKIILLVVLVVLAGGTTWAITNNKFLMSLLGKKEQTPENRVSVFSNVMGNVSIEEGKAPAFLSPDVEEQFKNDPEGKMIFRYGWGVDFVELNTPWDYTKVPARGKLEEYNAITKEMTITFSNPITTPVYKTTKKLMVPSDCTSGNTYFFEQETGKTYSDRVFTNELKPGVYVESFCLDNNCNSLGKLCKIVKYADGEEEVDPTDPGYYKEENSN